MSRSKRKLEYIRIKNRLRTIGGKMSFVMKMSDTPELAEEVLNDLKESEVPKLIKKLKTKWKKDFVFDGTVVGYDGNDFVYQRKSVLFNFRCYGCNHKSLDVETKGMFGLSPLLRASAEVG